jgi:hypothetical protein
MDFEEKIDALRMNLELAFHDIEAMGVKLEAVGVKIEGLYETSQVLLKATENLVTTANSHQDDLQALKKISGDLVRIAEVHDRRISGLEGRI